MGPLGAEVAEVDAVLDKVKAPELVLVAVEFAIRDVDDCWPLPDFEYMLRRFGPPQYSNEFPLQGIF